MPGGAVQAPPGFRFQRRVFYRMEIFMRSRLKLPTSTWKRRKKNPKPRLIDEPGDAGIVRTVARGSSLDELARKAKERRLQL